MEKVFGTEDGKLVTVIKPVRFNRGRTIWPEPWCGQTAPGARKRKDWQNLLSPATVHVDCLLVFMRSYPGREALDKLWLKAFLSTAWEVRLPQPSRDITHSTSFLSMLLGGALVEKEVPPEILIIQGNSSSHDFWRYLARAFSQTMIH